jgi:predicted DNA-binding transcriptional regulator AlpA
MPNIQQPQSTHKRELDFSTTDAKFADNHRRNQFLKKSDVAARLGMSIHTLKRLWAEGNGPRRRVLSPRVQGCTIGDIEDFLEAAKVG